MANIAAALRVDDAPAEASIAAPEKVTSKKPETEQKNATTAPAAPAPTPAAAVPEPAPTATPAPVEPKPAESTPAQAADATEQAKEAADATEQAKEAADATEQAKEAADATEQAKNHMSKLLPTVTATENAPESAEAPINISITKVAESKDSLRVTTNTSLLSPGSPFGKGESVSPPNPASATIPIVSVHRQLQTVPATVKQNRT